MYEIDINQPQPVVLHRIWTCPVQSCLAKTRNKYATRTIQPSISFGFILPNLWMWNTPLKSTVFVATRRVKIAKQGLQTKETTPDLFGEHDLMQTQRID